ncbi:MAG: NusG domain II-containing protein [Firmicutes bacterium]|nr:NusG domain II-containing protein [Bacillota bacterium]
MIKKGDFLISAVLILAALAGMAISSWGKHIAKGDISADIYLNGELIKSVAKSEEEQVIRLESAAGYNVMQISPQGIRILEADCRNQDCVQAGLIYRSGEIIACLPHRLLIVLRGQKESEFDAISR